MPKSVNRAVLRPNSSGRPNGIVTSSVPIANNSAPLGRSVSFSFGPTPALSNPLKVLPPLKNLSLILKSLLP